MRKITKTSFLGLLALLTSCNSYSGGTLLKMDGKQHELDYSITVSTSHVGSLYNFSSEIKEYHYGDETSTTPLYTLSRSSERTYAYRHIEEDRFEIKETLKSSRQSVEDEDAETPVIITKSNEVVEYYYTYVRRAQRTLLGEETNSEIIFVRGGTVKTSGSPALTVGGWNYYKVHTLYLNIEFATIIIADGVKTMETETKFYDGFTGEIYARYESDYLNYDGTYYAYDTESEVMTSFRLETLDLSLFNFSRLSKTSKSKGNI